MSFHSSFEQQEKGLSDLKSRLDEERVQNQEVVSRLEAQQQDAVTRLETQQEKELLDLKSRLEEERVQSQKALARLKMQTAALFIALLVLGGTLVFQLWPLLPLQ